MPEIGGLVACFSLAAFLRVRGGGDPAVDEKAWAAIMREWPICQISEWPIGSQQGAP